MRKTSLDYSEHNKKIAKLRGNPWKIKLRAAKALQKGPMIKALALARLNENITQRDMMKYLKTNNNTIYARIERGDVTTNRVRAELISRVLNKSVKDLFIEFDKDRFIAL